MVAIHCFEDEQVDDLYPVTLTRSAAFIPVGSWTLHELLTHAAGEVPMVLYCRAMLLPLTSRHATVAACSSLDPVQVSRGDVLWLNAALRPDPALVGWIGDCLRRREAFRMFQGKRLLAAWAPAGTSYAPVVSCAGMGPMLAALDLPVAPAGILSLMEEVFHIVQAQKELCASALEYRLRRGGYRELGAGRKGVWVADGVNLPEMAAFRTADGPVILDQGVNVLDFAFFRGPVYLGPGTKVIEHAAVKDGVSTGRTCKIGGEIECAVMDSYSNKQHHGFLGHAFIGSWVNMGAGTSNSDLKNTYGTIQVSRKGERVSTGLQFFGCVMGDYSKTAINTSIFTGKIIGVNSMLYGFIGQNVPSFTNYANSFGQITSVDLDQAIRTQGRMFARRGIEQAEADIQLLRQAYQLTLDERRLSSEALIL